MFGDGAIDAVCRAAGFRVRDRHRQFVLPIALHKAVSAPGFTSAQRGRPARRRRHRAVRLAGHAGRRTRGVMAEAIAARRVLVTGATGFTGGHLARRLAADGVAVRALVRNPHVAAPALPGIELAAGDLTDAGSLARAVAGVDVVYNIAALYRAAGLDDDALSRRQRDRGRHDDRSRRRGRREARRPLQHRRRPRRHRAAAGQRGRAAAPGRRLPGDEARRGERWRATRGRARPASSSSIVRPTGIYGPGDRRLLKLFRGVARAPLRRSSAAATSGTI